MKIFYFSLVLLMMQIKVMESKYPNQVPAEEEGNRSKLHRPIWHTSFNMVLISKRHRAI